MKDEIILTKDEALTILKSISNVDGFLMSINNGSVIQENLDFSIDLLTEKLGGKRHLTPPVQPAWGS